MPSDVSDSGGAPMCDTPAVRFNPPPGWPVPSHNWTPSPDWAPDPAWPPAPPGWQFWTADEAPAHSPVPADRAGPTSTNRYLIPAVIVAAAVAALVVAGGVIIGKSRSPAEPESVTMTQAGRPTTTRRVPLGAEPQAPPAAVVDGDLGLSVPMSRPACDGTGIVVLASVITPGQYAQGVQRALNVHPGASYLRTDQACPSLRQATESGDAIYAVYRVAGRSRADVCGAVRAAGGDAYGKWLDTTTDPSYMIEC